MIEQSTVLQLLGSLMKQPSLLSETDRYNLIPNDFNNLLDKYIFAAISNLYHNGATKINPIDIENYLETNESASKLFKDKNGIEYLQDAEALSDENTFEYYYKRLKKYNLLIDLKSQGIDISDFYDDSISSEAIEKNKKFEEYEIQDILNNIKSKILGIERKFINNDTSETISAADNIEDILTRANEKIDIGPPVQGHIFNEVIAGARRGAFVVRSAASGIGKSRNAVGDACYLAYPLRYEEAYNKWMNKGSNQKVLFIATEQSLFEIQRMILAYLTGFNESKFRYGNFNEQELKIVQQAIKVMKLYEKNFFIVKMPNPTVELIKSLIRENVLLHEIDCVFYDYIFIGPALLNEFKGFRLRNDELLLIMSTALKDLAVELDIFVMTSTQVNSNIDNNSEGIHNESTIAGSRSIINKADIGTVIARPTKEELQIFNGIDFNIDTSETLPNMVTDVYKVRSGEYNQVRIWSKVDLGNLRKIDLFMTDNRLEVINDIRVEYNYIEDWESSDCILLIDELNKEINK